jgi:hypothetical protein
MSQTDLVTVTGHMWNNLDPEVKKKYEDEYHLDKVRYDLQMADFYKNNPNEKKSMRSAKPCCGLE